MMKASPVSGDMLVKMGLGVALLGALGLVLWKVKSMAPAALAALNPANPENIINKTINDAGGKMVEDPDGPGKNADGSWTLGGWVHDMLNKETAQAVKDMSGPVKKPAPTIPADPYAHVLGQTEYDELGNVIN